MVTVSVVKELSYYKLRMGICLQYMNENLRTIANPLAGYWTRAFVKGKTGHKNS